MTIAISVKVNDGLILGADSASTMSSLSGGISNIYNHADKIFNLVKGLPIGAITWGAGSMGPASISTLAKDLRRRFSGDDIHHGEEWIINPKNYNVGHVASLFRRFFFDEIYTAAFSEWEVKPSIGFVVGGYSSDEMLSENYLITIDDGFCPEPLLMWQKNESGINWFGQPEAITRLVIGYDSRLKSILQAELNLDEPTCTNVINKLTAVLGSGIIESAMPIQDAIDLTEYLVDLTIKYSRFTPGAPTVGGAIEIAAISKHEGFKWIRRKHYYKPELNGR